MQKAMVREKYCGLSQPDLLDEAYKLGFNFEKYNYSCSQSVVAALHELLEIDDVVVRVSMPLSGGTAEQFMGTCGALSGGLLVLSYFFGRSADKLSYEESKKDSVDALFVTLPITQLLADKFVGEYGTIMCPHIHRQIFGRTWWLRDPQDLEKFEKAGGHTAPDKCCHVAGTGARWALEVLIDQEALKS